MAEQVNLDMSTGSLKLEQYTFELLLYCLHFIGPLSILGYQNDELFSYCISSFYMDPMYVVICSMESSNKVLLSSLLLLLLLSLCLSLSLSLLLLLLFLLLLRLLLLL